MGVDQTSYSGIEELETWFREVWSLNKEVKLTGLNEDLMLLEFNSPERAKWVLESGRRSFKGGRIQLDWWSPESGCTRSRGVGQEVWIRVVGLPLHLRKPEILRKIGDACGGFVAEDKGTGMKSEIKWARMLIKTEGIDRPNTVNILEGPRSYELQIWWEFPPWVMGVYPTVSRRTEKDPKEEDEVLARAGERVVAPSPRCNVESVWVQRSGPEKEKWPGVVGAVRVNSKAGTVKWCRNGTHVEGVGINRVGFYRTVDGNLQQNGLTAEPKVWVDGAKISGPLTDKSKRPFDKRGGSGRLKAPQIMKTFRPSDGSVKSGGSLGHAANGPKIAGIPLGPNSLMEGVKGNRGTSGGGISEGITEASNKENRDGDGGSRLRMLSSLESMADPAWICSRDTSLYVQEDKTSMRGTPGFECGWEKGPGQLSSDFPLLGLRHPDQGEIEVTVPCSLALMDAVTRSPVEFDPEFSRLHTKVSRFETELSNVLPPPIFSVFGRPLLAGGSSSLGESDDHVDLGEMEPLRVVSADGREWGKELAVVSREGDQTDVGIGSLCVEHSVVNSVVKGYDTWKDSCLIKFSEFLGVTTAGFEEEILELMRKMHNRQHGDRRKGDHAETRCERELRKLECTINYNGKGQNRGGRDRGNFLLKLK